MAHGDLTNQKLGLVLIKMNEMVISISWHLVGLLTYYLLYGAFEIPVVYP